jgi:hypothetical protein
MNCATCGHAIEIHRPIEYGKDLCSGEGLNPCWCKEKPCHEPHGAVCKCEGFAIWRPR